jgi:hypothetical protein
VYLTTHGVRARDLQLSTADHRDECKLGCRVQDSVSVRVTDMGGQVGDRGRGGGMRAAGAALTRGAGLRTNTRTCASRWRASARWT